MSTSFKQFSIPSLAKMINEHNHVHVLYAGQAAAKNQRLPAPALVITPIPLSICTVSIKILIICIIFRTFTPHSSTNIECHNMEHMYIMLSIGPFNMYSSDAEDEAASDGYICICPTGEMQ